MRSQPPHLTKAQMEIRSAHRVHLRPLPAQGEDIQDELQRTGLSQLLLPGRPPGLVIHHESFLTRLTEVYAIDTTTQTNALSNLHTVLRRLCSVAAGVKSDALAVSRSRRPPTILLTSLSRSRLCPAPMANPIRPRWWWSALDTSSSAAMRPEPSRGKDPVSIKCPYTCSRTACKRLPRSRGMDKGSMSCTRNPRSTNQRKGH